MDEEQKRRVFEDGYAAGLDVAQALIASARAQDNPMELYESLLQMHIDFAKEMRENRNK